MRFPHSLFQCAFASPAPKGDGKQGGDEGFSVPRGKTGGGVLRDAEEWPTWSTLLNFKCFLFLLFLKRSICCVTLNSRGRPEPGCLGQGATHPFTSQFRALVLLLGGFAHY